jgi:hypothetical protein
MTVPQLGGGAYAQAESIYLFASQAGNPLNLAALVATANEGVNLVPGLSWEGARAEAASAPNLLRECSETEPVNTLLGIEGINIINIINIILF